METAKNAKKKWESLVFAVLGTIVLAAALVALGLSSFDVIRLGFLGSIASILGLFFGLMFSVGGFLDYFDYGTA